MRWPEVLEVEPKLKVLPLRSARVLMRSSVVMKTERNLASSSRCTSGMALPPERTSACTKVKPPNQTKSTCWLARASTAAA